MLLNLHRGQQARVRFFGPPRRGGKIRTIGQISLSEETLLHGGTTGSNATAVLRAVASPAEKARDGMTRLIGWTDSRALNCLPRPHPFPLVRRILACEVLYGKLQHRVAQKG